MEIQVKIKEAAKERNVFFTQSLMLSNIFRKIAWKWSVSAGWRQSRRWKALAKLIHMFVIYVVNSYRTVFQRFLLGCSWSYHQTIQLVLNCSQLVFVLVWLTYFDYNLFYSLALCLFQFSILSEWGKISREKKNAYSWIVNTSLVLLSFIFSS